MKNDFKSLNTHTPSVVVQLSVMSSYAQPIPSDTQQSMTMTVIVALTSSHVDYAHSNCVPILINVPTLIPLLLSCATDL
jgi:hypothetical protein